MREQLLGPEHLDVAESLADLARLIESVGNLLDAEHFIKRAIAIRGRAVRSCGLRREFRFWSTLPWWRRKILTTEGTVGTKGHRV